MAHITIYRYLAYSRPETKQAVIDLMRNEGYAINPRNEADLELCIQKFVQHMGIEQALPLLASVHPDRELILDSVQPATLNADGAFEAVRQTNNNQQPITNKPFSENNSSQTTHIIVAGLLCTTLIGMVGIILRK